MDLLDLLDCWYCGSSGSAGSSGFKFEITGTGAATYIPLFNGTNTLTSVTQQTINVNSTLTINGQSQSVYFEVGALLQYSVPNSGEIVSSEQYHINRYR
jgi:hypothetical protein